MKRIIAFKRERIPVAQHLMAVMTRTTGNLHRQSVHFFGFESDNQGYVKCNLHHWTVSCGYRKKDAKRGFR